MMLDLYSHYLNIVRLTFADDARFSKAFKQACEHFINHLPHMSESLAIHAHYFLDRNCPESRTETIDVALDSIILLFNFIHDKDLFHRCYARLLASRIINFSSASDEAEMRMMKHLRQVCGFQYAMTLQRMYMDKNLSCDLSADFRRYVPNRQDAHQDDAFERKESGHLRRKSDSSIDFIETEGGRITPRTLSPRSLQSMRFIGLHDASPLQTMLSKRVFADKNKRYKGEHSTGSTPGSLRGTPMKQQPMFFAHAEDDMDVGQGSSDDVFSEAVAVAPPEIDFFAFVLTGGSWPYQPQTVSMNLPAPLTRCMQSFGVFYDAKFKRRRLAWLHELGHGEVLARGLDKVYTLSVSTYQMSILVLFNEHGSLTVEAIAQALDLDCPEVATALYPLLKAQVLVGAPGVVLLSQLTKQTAIRANDAFSRRGSRVAIQRKCDDDAPSGALSPRNLDPSRISPSVLNERKGAVEARIVWLMKQNGTMRHEKLIEGVLDHTRALNFVPPRDFVCEIIRNDIEKDFIELMEDGPNPLYRYQA
jgi:hypothetical protein